MSKYGMRAKDLIALLQKADPEAPVFGEFEGGIFTIEPNDVRIGSAHFVHYSTGNGGFWSSGESRSPSELDEDPAEVGVLLWAGQSATQWPNRLDGEKTEEEK